MSAATRGSLAAVLAGLLALGAATAGGGGGDAAPTQVRLPEVFTAPSIEEIRIEGVTGRLAVQVEFAIDTRVGADPASANVDRDLDNIVRLGSFRRVEAAFLEGGRVLVFTLTPNPVLAAIVIAGNTAFSAEEIRAGISADAARTGRPTLSPGQVVNSVALEDDRGAIVAFYRSSGFPFDPEVRSVLDLVGEQLVLTFVVEDAPLLTGLRFSGASAFPADQLAQAVAAVLPNQSVTDAPDLFALETPAPFDLATFSAAAAALNNLYAQEGLSGSGTDARASTFGAGVLSIALRELRIARVSGGALAGIAAGDLFNMKALADAIDAAAEAGSNLEPEVLVNPDSTVSIRLIPGRSETITAIAVAGNAGLSRDDITGAMRLQVGQPPNQFLLNQDLGRIARLYLERGFALAGQLPGQGGRPQIEGNFRDSVLTVTVAEVRLEAVQFTFRNPNAVTQPVTVNRQLAIRPGDPFSVNGVVATLRNLAGTNLFNSIDPSQDVVIAPGSAPDLAVVEIRLTERPFIVPSLTVGTRTQAGQVSFFGQASLSLTNLFGLGQTASASLGIDPQGTLDFELGYFIPFLQLFNDDQTGLQLRVFNTSTEGVALAGLGGGGTFTLVSQGVSLGLTRPLAPDLDLGLRLESTLQFALPDPLFPAPPVGEDFVPMLPGLVTQVGAGLTLDTRDSLGFPTTGLTISADLDLGFGDDIFDDGMLNPVGFLRPVASSAQFLAIEPGGNLVLALREAVGLVSGVAPLDELLRVGGNSPSRTVIIQRGLNADSFIGTFAAGATLEVRFRIPLEPVATLVPVLFTDFTTITTEDQPVGITTLGFGVGLQINLEVPGLPPIPVRLDFGFSDVNPSGVLLFSVNPLF